MPQELMKVAKIKAASGATKLELSVAKTDGPVSTAVEVVSTGPDDKSFTDKQLTPGPARMPLDPNNTYSLGWTGAFAAAGTVTLTVKTLRSDGTSKTRPVPVKGKQGDVFFRLVLIS